MIIVKQPGPPERLRLPPVQSPHADAPAPVSPQPLRTSPASPCSAAASLAGLWCRRRRGRGLAALSACAHPGRAGAGWRESRLFRSGAAGPGGCSPASLPFGVPAAGPPAARRQSLVAGPGLHFLLGRFPCSFQPRAARFLCGPEAKGPGIPKCFKVQP